MAVDVIEAVSPVDALGRPTYVQLTRTGLATLDISDMLLYSLVEFRGMGMAPLHRLTTRGPYQHGTSDRGYRLDPRPVYMVMHVHGESHGHMYEARQALFPYLRPGLDPVGIRFSYTGTDSVLVQRQIDCHMVRGMDGSTADQRAWRQREVIELVANDPTFYDPTPSVRTLSLDGGGTGVTLSDLGAGTVTMKLGDPGGADTPMAGGLGAGSLIVTMPEPAAWDTYPTISCYGPMTGLTITNEATGDVIAITGTIPNGDVWTIDLRFGYKTIRDAAGTNQIGGITSASSLATFRLVPGTNNITVSATGTSSATLVKLTYYRRFLGV